MAKAAKNNLKVLKHRMSTEGLDFDSNPILNGVKVKQIMVGDYGHTFPMWINA